MSKDAQDMSNKFHRLANTSHRVNKVAVSTAAISGKAITAGAMLAAGVTPGKPLSGLKRGKISPAYDLLGESAVIKLRGPAQLVNNPTSAHPITPRGAGTGRRRRAGKRALTIGSNVRASANHPGTHGKHFWEAAEGVMRRKLPEVIQKTHRGAWAREFTGG
jgi:hypothetical protein